MNSHLVSRGYCQQCQCEHVLPIGEAYEEAQRLIQRLNQEQCIDFDSQERNPNFSLNYLWGPALGQMFGVLVGYDDRNRRHVLKAFSCQYNGCWQVKGWVNPLFDVSQYLATIEPVDKEIKLLGNKMKYLDVNSLEYNELKRTRKQLSVTLMQSLHQLYCLHNFRGETSSLADAFVSQRKGIPTGCGDCCAPKLLNEAAKLGLRVSGLAEFYYGATNRSGTKQHQQFYVACEEKCRPILGFMLCGLT